MNSLTIEKQELPKWRKKAQFRKENKSWLKYSGKIALRILAALEDNPNLNQKKLAELAGVSPQQVNKIVKGEENLTLQSIAKFSEILGVDLIVFPQFKYHKPSNVNFIVLGGENYIIMPLNGDVLVNSNSQFQNHSNNFSRSPVQINLI